MKRTTVTFPNREGLNIKGIIFEPDDAQRRKTGVVYLPGIVLGLTAVHRLAVDVACEFQRDGYPVLLFDHARIGESEGSFVSGPYEEFVNFIKQGGLVDDTLEALQFFLSRCNLENIILIGHCGGALTALYAAQKSNKIAQLILIVPPLMGETTEGAGMTKGQAKEYLALYKHKMFSPAAWSRLFLGKSDYRQMIKAVKAKIFRSKPETGPGDANLNRVFVKGLESVGGRIDVRIIYGDRDPGFEEFKDCEDEFNRGKIRTTVFPDASHGFVTDKSMRLLMAELKAPYERIH